MFKTHLSTNLTVVVTFSKNFNHDRMATFHGKPSPAGGEDEKTESSWILSQSLG